MAELNVKSTKAGSRRQTSKMPVRVDLTAMVDLAFLLITFFMLTTSLKKPHEMTMVVPVPGPEGFVPESSTMSIDLGKKNQVLCYIGMPQKPLTTPKQLGYGEELRQEILETQKKVFQTTGKQLIVIVKPAKSSIYDNLVNVLDELNIANVQTYSIAAITSNDINFLSQKGLY